MAGGRPGGPSTLLPEQKKAFLDTLRLPGASRDLAALRARIGVRTVYRWLALGKKAAKSKSKKEREGEYSQFWQEVQGVEAEAELSALAMINNAARRAKNPDWRAAAWVLERRRPKKYLPPQRVAVGGDKDAGPIPIEFTPAIPLPPGVKAKDGKK